MQSLFPDGAEDTDMVQLAVVGQIGTNQTTLDHGISDLLVLETEFGAMLYTSTGQTGGVAAFALGADGSATLADAAYFNHAVSANAFTDLVLIETGNGMQLVVGNEQDGDLITYQLDATGMIGTAGRVTGAEIDLHSLLDVDQAGANKVFVAIAGTHAIQSYAMDANGALSAQIAVADTDTTYARDVFAIETVRMNGVDYLIGASQTEQGLSAFRVDNSGLQATGNMGVDQGLGMMTPTDMQVVALEGRNFVLVASAPGDGIGRSGAISVMELAADGSLVATDHVIDTLHTRFGNVQSLEVIEANGRVYVVAAGGDDGMTLFVLLPNGRLQILDVLADSFGAGLENISAISAYHQANTLHFFVASEISPGVTEVTVDTTDHGSTILAPNSGGETIGTSQDDILIGGTGPDLLRGGGGQDILEDGAGRDTLFGGSGGDIFVLRADGEHDEIADFDWTRDRIDLSDWPFLYDPAQLTVTSTATGAIVTWRGEYLVITTADGTSLTALQVISTIKDAPNRPPGLDGIGSGDGDRLVEGDQDKNYLRGSGANDTIFGYQGNDTLVGYDGDDVLNGGDGYDRLIGGDGADTLRGGLLNDQLDGNAGDDVLEGGAGHDDLFGGLGSDILRGGEENDDLYGGGDNDSLFGGTGNDRLYGDEGSDFLSGDAGRDTLTAGNGSDTLEGGDDDDLLDGGSGSDRLAGDAGNDTLNGGTGGDVLTGGQGDDVLNGGTQDDRLLGDGGFDTLNGEGGDDTLFGGDAADQLHGDAGHDRLSGDDGNDRLLGGLGDDTLFGGTGRDMLDGGQGNNLLDGGAQDDRLLGRGGFDTLKGDSGDDVLFGGNAADTLHGDAGHDRLAAGPGNDRLFGGLGRDTLIGGAGADTLDGGQGNNLLDGGNQPDRLIGRGGFDTLQGGNGNDTLFGGGAADTLYGDAGHDRLAAGPGNDRLFGGRGNDTLNGSTGHDTLLGGLGNDWLEGGGGADVFVFETGQGNDTIHDFEAKAGSDVIDLSAVAAIGSMADLTGQGGAATQAGEDVRIDIGANGVIWLLGVDMSDLEADHFLF